MRTPIRHLLLSEFHSAVSYVDRLFHAIVEIGQLVNHPRYKPLLHQLHFDLQSFIETNLIRDQFLVSGNDTAQPVNAEIRRELDSIHRLIEIFLELNFHEEKTTEMVVNYINLLYTHAQQLHQFAFRETQLVIEYPRINLISMEQDEKNPQAIAKFSLSLETVKEYISADVNFLGGLDWQRNKKFEALLQKGHQAIYYKKPEDALQFFLRALKYKETAEILNLLGWASYLTGKSEDAKSYCMKAIQKDADYGPPYNDLGSYILAEGQINEALKWFTLAKKAPNYPNREFAFINAGRAYLAKKDFDLALEEFTKAEALAPYRDDIKETIQKIRETIAKESKHLHPI